MFFLSYIYCIRIRNKCFLCVLLQCCTLAFFLLGSILVLVRYIILRVENRPFAWLARFQLTYGLYDRKQLSWSTDWMCVYIRFSWWQLCVSEYVRCHSCTMHVCFHIPMKVKSNLTRNRLTTTNTHMKTWSHTFWIMVNFIRQIRGNSNKNPTTF